MTLRTSISTLALVAALAAPVLAQQDAPAPYTLKVTTDIVLTNVIVRDKKTGALIKGLKPSDFTVFEDGKQQKIVSFDFQNVDDAAALLASHATISGKTSVADLLNHSFAADPSSLHDHRLMVFFFDLTSMQPEDVDRAVDSAVDFVNQKMQPADLIALVSLDTGLSMDQDFTADKTALLRGLSKYGGTEGTGFTAGGTTGSTDSTADDAGSYAADDSEYAALNTDRELYAIEAIAKAVGRVDGRKSMLYFSGGLTRQGIENQASMRVATNEAVKANMAIYSVDTRGLQALPPLGDASTGSLRGTASYSGAATQNNLNANFASQETLATLASDTGGKFFGDSNDFSPIFQQVQHDTEAYYILGFKSSDPARDGRFRHLTIKLNRAGSSALKDVKLEYRPGYYAPADFKHATAEDREVALTEQMKSDLPATDVPLYLQALYFKLENGTFYVPISLIVPGSAIPFLKNGDKDKANLDLVGEVKNAQGIIVGNIRDTVKLNLTEGENVKQRNIQYTTGFALATGKYHLKFVVRENQTGQMGSFETDLNVPDLKKIPLKLSSIVLASQRLPNKDKNPVSPLIRDGQEWIPNIPHVFRQDQHLYFLYEVYDPAHQKGASSQPAPETPANLRRRPSLGGVRVLTSIEFILGGVKVYETPLVEATAINAPTRGAVSFQFDVPLAPLKPGDYLCQINVIDDAGGSFSFPQLALRINPPTAPTAQIPPPTPATNPTPPATPPATP